MMDIVQYYDGLIDEDNDPVHDCEPLREYMDKWDGQGFIDRMCLDKDKTVLEVGCGTGRLLKRTAPLCKAAVGIDISPKTVQRAKKNLSECENISLVCADFLKHEFFVNFDIIYSSLTFMHIEDKKRAIEKIASLLVKNGKFILSTDKNQAQYIENGSRRVLIYPDTPSKIISFAEAAGLVLCESYETEFAEIFVFEK